MVFNSITFLVFSGIFFPVYFLLKGRLRMGWSLLASYVFYGWWDWRLLFFLASYSLLVFILGISISDSKSPLQRAVRIELESRAIRTAGLRIVGATALPDATRWIEAAQDP